MSDPRMLDIQIEVTLDTPDIQIEVTLDTPDILMEMLTSEIPDIKIDIQ